MPQADNAKALAQPNVMIDGRRSRVARALEESFGYAFIAFRP